MTVGTEISFPIYERDQTFSAPETPGIYAWLLYPQISSRLASDKEKLAHKLEKFEEFAQPQPIELQSARSSFKSKWESTVKLESKAWHSDDLFSGELDVTEASASHFNQIMAALAPVVYVGKANNLRSRIQTHVKVLEKIDQWEHLDLEEEGISFAERVHKMEIPLPLLRFTFFEFPTIHRQQRDITKANEIVEGIVNRILKPSLGRR